MRTTIPGILATLATGLLAGAFLYGTLNLVPTFYEVPMNVHLRFRIQLMDHNSISMQLLMAISILTPLWYARVNRDVKKVVVLSLLAAAMALTALLVTRFGNVPINFLIRKWSDTGLPSDYQYHLKLWDNYNIVRSTAAIASFILIIAATQCTALKRSSMESARLKKGSR